MELPVVNFDSVYRVGSEAMLKGGLPEDMALVQGNGLAVSPSKNAADAWAALTKTNGALWQLDRPESAFVNIDWIDDEIYKEIVAWGIENGLAEEVQAWHGISLEEDRESWVVCETEAEALEYADSPEDVRSAVEVRGTEKLGQLVGYNAPVGGWHMVVLAYVQEMTQLDGIYFPDAEVPVAVIAANRLDGWQPQMVREQRPQLNEVETIAEKQMPASASYDQHIEPDDRSH